MTAFKLIGKLLNFNGFVRDGFVFRRGSRFRCY